MEDIKVRPHNIRSDRDEKRQFVYREDHIRGSNVVRPVVARLSSQYDEPKRKLLRSLIHVAWLAIALGLIMQLLLAVIRFGILGDVEPSIAELTNKIAWSFLVCTGLAIGGSFADEKGIAIGLSGLITAPVAFILARGLHKAVADLLATTGPAENPFIWVTAGVRGVEYMLLGLAIHWLAGKSWAKASAHLVTGLIVGLVFGSVGLLFTPSITTSLTGVLSWGVNELIFPMGCALALFAAKAVSDKVVVERPSQNLTPIAG